MPRRSLFKGIAALGLAAPLLPVLAPSVAAAQPADRFGGLPIHPRSDWAGDLAPKGELREEAPGDVRFLLVHHTASGNGYGRDRAPQLIRSFYELHTGDRKNWPDVAYNFFIDRYGEIWEGRSGSLDGPVIADATGGNQGFAQLCCFIGSHQEEPPTAEAAQSMVQLLAALADTYGIDTTPGATTSFESRGSNRWSAGSQVVAATISGHRDMSQTECPGSFAYTLVTDVFPTEVTAIRAASSTATASAASSASSPSPAPTTSPTADAAPASAEPVLAPKANDSVPTGSLALSVGLGSAAALGAVAAGAVLLRRRVLGQLAAAHGQGTDGSAALFTGITRPTLKRWEAVDLASSNGGPPSVAAILVRRPTAIVGVVASASLSDGPKSLMLDRGREVAHQFIEKLAPDDNPADLAAKILDQVDRELAGAALDMAVMVVLPTCAGIAATDVALGAIVTPDGGAYRPRIKRSRNDETWSRLAQVSRPNHEVAAMLLVTPAGAVTRGAVDVGNLPALARDMVSWPNVSLGLRNHLRNALAATGRSPAVVAAINRRVLIDAVRDERGENV